MNYESLNIRIEKHEKGYVVEVKKPRWTLFGIKWRWTHYISVSGISEQPWYYSSYDIAEKEALFHIRIDLIKKTFRN